jgi:hypothetical protein
VRIRDGKYILSGKDQIEAALKHKDSAVEELRSRLGTIAHYAEAQKKLHTPYVSGTLDVSTRSTEQKSKALCDQIGQNLWCSECQTRWPCRKIEEARTLQRFAQGHLDEQQEDDFKTTIRNMVPRKREGQLQVHV